MSRWLRDVWRAVTRQSPAFDGRAYDQGRFDEHMDILLGRTACSCCRTTHASVGEP